MEPRRFTLAAIAIAFSLPFFPLPSWTAEGDLVWAVRAGGPGDDDNQDAAPFDDGTTVITGYFHNTATFGAGEANETELTSAGGWDIYLAKYVCESGVMVNFQPAGSVVPEGCSKDAGSSYGPKTNSTCCFDWL